MSRTYRCRNLPKVAGRRWCGTFRANKIIDGGGGWRKFYRAVEAETEARLGYGTPDYKDSYGYTKTGTHDEYIDVPKPKNWDRFEKQWLGEWRWQPQARKRIVCKGARRPTHEYAEWMRVYGIVSDELVRDVATWHPYARKRQWNRAGKYGEARRRANREMRRRNRQIIRSNMIDDDWDGGFCNPDLYLDVWDFSD